jgi:hypothetical protein
MCCKPAASGLTLGIVTFTQMEAHQTVYRRSHQGRSRSRGRAKRLTWLVFNLTLLVAASASYGAAIHYYNLGETQSRENTLDSEARVRNAYGHTMFYCLVGLLPLALGIRGEVRRKIALEKRAQAKKNRAAQEKVARSRSSLT